MIKQIVYLSAMAASLLLMSGCNGSKDSATGQLPAIELGEALSNNTDITLSKFGSKIQYIPLETADSGLVSGTIQALRITDRYIIVTNNNSSNGDCLVFDRETGKFLNTVAHKGQDPEAVSNTIPVIDFETGNFTFPGTTDKLQIYRPDGKYEGSIQLPCTARNINCYIFDGKDALVYTGANFKSGNRDILRISPDGALLDSLTVLNDSILFSVDMNEITGISVMMIRNNPGAFLVFNLKGDKTKYLSAGFESFWKNGSDIRFREMFMDTIFNYTDNQLVPAYKINLGENSFTIKDIATKEITDKTPVILNINENDHDMIIQGRFNILTHNDFIALYNKEEGTTVAGSVEETGITNDIDGFMPVKLYTLTQNGDFAGLITIDEISAWLDENPGYEFPENLAWIKNLSDDSNPIVVIVSK